MKPDGLLVKDRWYVCIVWSRPIDLQKQNRAGTGLGYSRRPRLLFANIQDKHFTDRLAVKTYLTILSNGFIADGSAPTRSSEVMCRPTCLYARLPASPLK